MKNEILIKCTTPQKALVQIKEIIETEARPPQNRLKVGHNLKRHLRMSEMDLLELLKKLELYFGDTARNIFGNNDDWKQLKTINSIVSKISDFAIQKFREMARTEDGALELIRLIAIDENLIDEEDVIHLHLDDDLKSFKLDSLDCIQLMAKIEESLGCPATSSVFRENWRSIEKVGDLVEDIQRYVS